MSAGAPLLSVRDLAVHFALRSSGLFRRERAFVRAVDGVSFDLARGEALGLVGESGSGKSTIARALIGLAPVTRGTLAFDGADLATLGARERRAVLRRIGVVFQDPFASLDPRQRVGATIAEPLDVHGIGTRRERSARVSELLDAVGLRAEHAQFFPHEFSGGQRQRIAIARALAARPELLVCDEPTSALDVSIQAQIVNLLRELGERFGLAYLFISHDLAVVRSLCTRIAVLYLGEVVELAPRAELFANPRHPYTRALLAAVPRVAPERPRPPTPLAGEVPSPLAPPSGCRFHPRCPERERAGTERCANVAPPLADLPLFPRVSVACHLYAERSSAAAAPESRV